MKQSQSYSTDAVDSAISRISRVIDQINDMTSLASTAIQLARTANDRVKMLEKFEVTTDATATLKTLYDELSKTFGNLKTVMPQKDIETVIVVEKCVVEAIKATDKRLSESGR